ncbi:MAG: histidine phosphatase family protein [Myxococcales bacterium]|nr:histidine phosphatase family protein [Myxococcales bacterium]
MATLSLYLVRHGQTDASLANRFCGRLDPPLNATGLAMADALAARYGREGFAEIVSSPLVRAQQTAAPTARAAGLPVTLDDGLVEIAYGEWDGRAEADVERDDAARFAAWAAHPGRVAPPGGESGADIAVRALAAVERIRARHAGGGGKVLVVSHKATLRVLVCALVGIDVDNFRARIAQKVCAVSIIDFKPSGPLLQILGDTSHLPPALRATDGT